MSENDLLGDELGEQEYTIGNEEEDRLLADDHAISSAVKAAPVKTDAIVKPPIQDIKPKMQTQTQDVKPLMKDLKPQPPPKKEVPPPLMQTEYQPPFVTSEEFSIGPPVKDGFFDFSEDILLGPSTNAGNGPRNRGGARNCFIKPRMQKKISPMVDNRHTPYRMPQFGPGPPFPPPSPFRRFEMGNGPSPFRGLGPPGARGPLGPPRGPFGPLGPMRGPLGPPCRPPGPSGPLRPPGPLSFLERARMLVRARGGPLGPRGPLGPPGPPRFFPPRPSVRPAPRPPGPPEGSKKLKIRSTKPWINEETIDLMRERDVLFRKWKSNPNNVEYKQTYNKARNKVTKLLTVAKSAYLEEL